eukprot:4741956-Pleurochrysis_carterae.AAC.2
MFRTLTISPHPRPLQSLTPPSLLLRPPHPFPSHPARPEGALIRTSSFCTASSRDLRNSTSSFSAEISIRSCAISCKRKCNSPKARVRQSRTKGRTGIQVEMGGRLIRHVKRVERRLLAANSCVYAMAPIADFGQWRKAAESPSS